MVACRIGCAAVSAWGRGAALECQATARCDAGQLASPRDTTPAV